ncbi:hypothetical protein HBI56_098300 [Parastagonospora nodorum]|uniref:Uncharacterized protein n=1 Tax=Phaeosphaeria nodorum (strain SN15 / ATCC MYA-4574 / FGSC 10173) TaxID=321614 RepID=A0A7U2F9J5_PHANO|nr:hypothetical protein HBH56_027310 [Parastagonospora nodorum]QRC99020.1 hypothetical protein JI435_412950 [Parastagonospora nodorum SN15]KAH3934127.1 hypothetical protein HBH54_054730 [Parastagonospora nodorum]KAH3949915.1 hypothetical protein HBH53_082420 [Parastagonospora nodorum]KAH3975933.1 hypothetical protein HBH51_082940 [Parastagonospora nodorum]
MANLILQHPPSTRGRNSLSTRKPPHLCAVFPNLRNFQKEPCTQTRKNEAMPVIVRNGGNEGKREKVSLGGKPLNAYETHTYP